MRHKSSEYERALRLSGSGADNYSPIIGAMQRTGSNTQTGNVLVSGQSTAKQSVILSLIAQAADMPVIVVSDSQRSRLPHDLAALSGMNFCTVTPTGGVANYNFMRGKDVSVLMEFFTEIASQHNLFDQNRAQAETLLRCVLQLASSNGNVVRAIVDNSLTGEFFSNEIGRCAGMTEQERFIFMGRVNSSIAAAQTVTATFNDLFRVIADERGFPFSVGDIIDRARHVCFCLNGDMYVRGRCWYLAKMLSFDLKSNVNPTSRGITLVIDTDDPEKLDLFKPLIGMLGARVVLNIDSAGFLVNNQILSRFNELYVFSHPDMDSAKFWSDFFSVHRVPEYTYGSSTDVTNPFSLLPFKIGSLFGTTTESTNASYVLKDRPVFEINEIRELKDMEFIYYNHSTRRLGVYTI